MCCYFCLLNHAMPMTIRCSQMVQIVLSAHCVSRQGGGQRQDARDSVWSHHALGIHECHPEKEPQSALPDGVWLQGEYCIFLLLTHNNHYCGTCCQPGLYTIQNLKNGLFPSFFPSILLYCVYSSIHPIYLSIHLSIYFRQMQLLC